MPRISLARTRKPLHQKPRRWQRPRLPGHGIAARWLAGFWSLAVAQITPGRIILGLGLIPILVYVVREATRDVLIIDPFTVPKRFEEAGITPDVMANRIGDAITDIETNTESTLAKRDNLTPFPDPANTFDVEIPGTKVDLKTLIDVTRTIFRNYPKHVSGDIYLPSETLPAGPTPGQNSQVVVTLYISEGRRRTAPISPRVGGENIDALAHGIAEAALEQINPYLVGLYKIDRGETKQAADIAERNAEDGRGDKRHKEAAFFLWGLVLQAEGKNDEAIARFQKAIELDPRSAYAYYNWGFALQAEGKNDEAIARFEKAIELDPKSAHAYNGWGNSLQAEGKNDEAIAKYQKAIELDPKYAYPYNNWGSALYTEGKNDEAIARFQKAIELDPKSAYTYSGWGNALQAEGKNDEAIARFQKAIELDPKSAFAYNSWGNALQAEGKNDEANERFKKAEALRSQSPK